MIMTFFFLLLNYGLQRIFSPEIRNLKWFHLEKNISTEKMTKECIHRINIIRKLYSVSNCFWFANWIQYEYCPLESSSRLSVSISVFLSFRELMSIEKATSFRHKIELRNDRIMNTTERNAVQTMNRTKIMLANFTTPNRIISFISSYRQWLWVYSMWPFWAISDFLHYNLHRIVQGSQHPIALCLQIVQVTGHFQMIWTFDFPKCIFVEKRQIRSTE